MSTGLTSPTATYPVPNDQHPSSRVPTNDQLHILESAYDELVRPGQRAFRRPGLMVPLLITFLTTGGAASGTRLIESPNVIGQVIRLNSRHGEVTSPSPVLQHGDRVDYELKRIRALTELSMNDMAHLCGIKRRQLYNLLDGSETEPHRAANIRRITNVIEKWSYRFPRPEMLRSALLAPLDREQQDFITLASSSAETNAIAKAIDLFENYMQRLGSANPVIRVSSSPATVRQEAVEQLRSLYGEDSPSARA